MPKNVKLFGLFENTVFENIKKMQGPLDTKNSKKSRTSPEKLEGGLLSPVRFCKCTEHFLVEAESRTRDVMFPPEARNFCIKVY